MNLIEAIFTLIAHIADSCGDWAYDLTYSVPVEAIIWLLVFATLSGSLIVPLVNYTISKIYDIKEWYEETYRF